MTKTSPLACYQLFDLIEDVTQLNVLLVLESPHINEYIHRHPAAGNAAAELTKFFTSQGYASCFNDDLPIGCNIKTQRYPFLGIMNCSSLPMNKEFYPCTISEDKAALVDKLMAMRTQLGKEINTDYIKPSAAECEMFTDFASRLTAVINATSATKSPVATTASVTAATAKVLTKSPLIIVPCGFVAANFIKRFQASYQGTLHVLEGVPHPSEAGWLTRIHEITITDSIAQQRLP